MDSYRVFKREVLEVEKVRKIAKGFKGFKNFYIRTLYKIKLACRVFHKFRTYKRSTTSILEEIETEAIETIVEQLENSIETINTIRENPRPVYSLKIKCKLQIKDWALDILGLIDTGCSNTILDQNLVPVNYQKPIPSNSQLMAE